jgi:two-component system, response regulator PdtaR
VTPFILKQAVVLVVDDEPLVLLTALDAVTGLGHIALEANDACEAITLLHTHPEITIVFTDIQMAGSMDGLALARYAADRWPPLHFIIVSGGVTPLASQMPLGAMFLKKPYGRVAIDHLIRGFD